MADSADKPDPAFNPANELASLSESDAITQVLKSGKTIAVVGLSSQCMRPSYGVAQYLQSAGYRIIPVNPNETEVLGEKSYARLHDVPVPIDIVDIFRRSQFVPEIVDAAIQIGARCVWMQEGVLHVEAAERARRAGIFVVMDKCTLKEHAKRARELQRRTKSS
ncbi:MAG: CoA-binding protein [Candidatus Acidiferrales bacterium]|jgi:predicted CoA-binding protein